MEINNKILESLDSLGIKRDDGICYLLALHYGYEPSYIPVEIKAKINTLRIYEMNKGILSWRLPLFEGQEVAFGWVKTEYVELFREANPQKGGKVREATSRMKKLFAHNPDIRKEDVLGAVKMYIRNTDSNYIREPHYFIEKGVGVQKTQDILDWIEKYKLAQQQGKGRVDITNTMQ